MQRNSNLKKLLPLLAQARLLAKRYDAVIANPPYMGSKGMNADLKEFAKKQFPNSKSDLFAIFIERNLDLTKESGVVAMITMQSWMFLSSYESLRTRILNQHTILSMTHLGARGFDRIGGEVVETTAFY
jgi:type I restriction-modification system DNA methylase subunit